MRTCLVLAIVLATSVRSLAQSPHFYDDVPAGGWEYATMERLRQASLFTGYPSGYFRGKRILTRYEFAVALDRMIRDKVSCDLFYGNSQGMLHVSGFVLVRLSASRAIREFLPELRSLGRTDREIASWLSGHAVVCRAGPGVMGESVMK